MAQGQINVNARSTIEALNDIAGQVRQLGVENVAKRAGLKPGAVKKFIADVMQAKNSDIRKIRQAVVDMTAEQQGGSSPEQSR